jgi:hypothetical protein
MRLRTHFVNRQGVRCPKSTYWLAGILAALVVGWVTANTFAGDGHWVTTWGCGPQLTEPGNLPPAPLANSTLRQFVHVTTGGTLCA